MAVENKYKETTTTTTTAQILLHLCVCDIKNRK